MLLLGPSAKLPLVISFSKTEGQDVFIDTQVLSHHVHSMLVLLLSWQDSAVLNLAQ